jgi:hypothetical protein
LQSSPKVRAKAKAKAMEGTHGEDNGMTIPRAKAAERAAGKAGRVLCGSGVPRRERVADNSLDIATIVGLTDTVRASAANSTERWPIKVKAKATRTS